MFAWLFSAGPNRINTPNNDIHKYILIHIHIRTCNPEKRKAFKARDKQYTSFTQTERKSKSMLFGSLFYCVRCAFS